MKQFKTLLFAAALIIGASSFMQAQSKVAHINTQDLIQAMPEMAAAQAEMEKLGKTYEADIKAMATEYQNKMKQYEAEASSKTDEENQKRLVEVQTMQQNIQDGYQLLVRITFFTFVSPYYKLFIPCALNQQSCNR